MKRYNVIMLECACGHELETDIPVEEAKLFRCPRCGMTSWTQRNLGKRLKKDSSAPTELIEAQEKERNRSV